MNRVPFFRLAILVSLSLLSSFFCICVFGWDPFFIIQKAICAVGKRIVSSFFSGSASLVVGIVLGVLFHSDTLGMGMMPQGEAGAGLQEEGQSSSGSNQPANPDPVLRERIPNPLLLDRNEEALGVIQSEFRRVCLDPLVRQHFVNLNFDELDYKKLVKPMVGGYPFNIQHQECLDLLTERFVSGKRTDISYIRGEIINFLNRVYPENYIP